jgi:hypothetical protein
MWEEVTGRRKNYIIRSFINRILHKILLPWSNQGGWDEMRWDGRDKTRTGKQKINNKLWSENFKGRGHMWDLGVSECIIIRMDLKETGIQLAHWRTLVDTVMNLRITYKARNLLTSWATVSFSSRIPLHPSTYKVSAVILKKFTMLWVCQYANIILGIIHCVIYIFRNSVCFSFSTFRTVATFPPTKRHCSLLCVPRTSLFHYFQWHALATIFIAGTNPPKRLEPHETQIVFLLKLQSKKYNCMKFSLINRVKKKPLARSF